jgi:PKD repeat protein
MKKVIYLLIAIPILMYSCQKVPLASFSTDNSEPEVGQEVHFKNLSDNSVSYEWDFGDGYGSTDENPVYIFTATGSFEVKLTVTSKSGLTDEAFMTVNVKIPTLLEIEVREFYYEDIVPNASVILYSSITDWDAQKNPEAEGITDKYGVVVFSNLGPYVFYVDVWEQNYDNYILRSEDVGFIRTPEILPHKINRFVAWVDYVQHKKGSASGAREMVIRKFERVSSSKVQPGDSGTEGWQELYAKRVNKK